MSRRRKLLFHVESLWGVGHVVRALRLLEALSQHFDCSVVSGSAALSACGPERFAALHTLPSVRYTPDCSRLEADGSGDLEAVLGERTDGVVRAFLTSAPDVLLVEMFPYGRHALLREMLTLFELAAGRSVPTVVSLRDICVYPEEPRPRGEYALVIGETLRAFGPLVLIHSDPAVQTVDDAVPADLRATAPADYVQTGYAGRRGVVRRPATGAAVWCNAGGGRSGGELLARAARLLRGVSPRPPATFSLGFHTPPDVKAYLTSELRGEAVEDFRLDRAFGPLESVGGLLVAGGYNAWMDILSARVPTLVVPLDEEQELRTKRLSPSCPWVRSVSLSDGGRAWEAAWGESVAAPKVVERPVRTDGAARAAEVIRSKFF